MKADNIEFKHMQVSCLHIYKNHMHDLFALGHEELTIKTQNDVHHDHHNTHTLSGLSKLQISNADEGIQLFKSSVHNRSYIEHQLNEGVTDDSTSNRSHVLYIFEMYL